VSESRQSVATVPAAPAGARGWQVVSALVRGTSHFKTNQPGQDRLRWEVLPGDRLLAVLADGAGSASFAEVGAELASNTAFTTFRARVVAPGTPTEAQWKQWLREALTAGRESVVAEAARREVRPRELASTLAILLVSRELVVAAQIGDGASVLGEADGELVAVTRPGLGEFINETTFVTADNALEAPQLEVRPGRWRRVAFFSDGLQLLALKLPAGEPHGPFFAPLFRFVAARPEPQAATAQLEAFLQSPRITDRTDDDLTLLLAVWPEAAA